MGTQAWIGRHIIETSDGNFLLCGDKTPGDAFVMKISPAQEILWSWFGGGSSVDYGTSVAEDADGNYYLGGAKEFSGSDRDFWVKAFESDGSQLWDTTYGSPYAEGVAYVRTASDGNLLMAGGYGIQDGEIEVKYISKLDRTDGSLIWENWYGPGGYGGALLSIKELPNGDLIGGGIHTIGPDYVGVMVRTTSEGDSLWMRTYYYQDSLTSSGKGIFRDVEPTSDGGFVAVGIAIAVTGIYPHALWVVKVDQYGCIEPGCHIITGMETQITNMRDALRVWPNPIVASGEIHLEMKLPDHFTPRGDLRMIVTSSDGRLVKEERLSNPLTALTLQLPQLSPGLYHLHLADDSRWISGVKVVVE